MQRFAEILNAAIDTEQTFKCKWPYSSNSYKNQNYNNKGEYKIDRILIGIEHPKKSTPLTSKCETSKM